MSLALELAEGRLGVGRQVVDHRVPDRSRELQQVRVHVTQLRERGQFRGARVVLVQESNPVDVLHPDRGVPQRAVRGCRHRLDHDLQATIEFDDLLVGQSPQVRESEVTQFRLHVTGRKVRIQHDGVLADMVSEVLGVEMVPVQVRHVQVVAVPQPVPIQAGVVGEGEPRGEVRGVHPGVTQDGPGGLCLDEDARVTGAGDPHGVSPLSPVEIPARTYPTGCATPWAEGP